jgi:hypothetical protein
MESEENSCQQKQLALNYLSKVNPHFVVGRFGEE